MTAYPCVCFCHGPGVPPVWGTASRTCSWCKSYCGAAVAVDGTDQHPDVVYVGRRCPVCHQERTLQTDGTMQPHPAPMVRVTWDRETCPGSGQRPASADR